MTEAIPGLDSLPAPLNELGRRPLPGLTAEADRVFPVYDGCSIASLPTSICHWLGAMPPEGAAPPLDEVYRQALQSRFRRVILMLVDGLGWHLLQRWAADAPWLREAYCLPLTSVVPSTTATALTSLWTATFPARHGILGYEMWLKEYGLIANMIFHSPAAFSSGSDTLKLAGFSAETFLQVPILAPHLAAQGIRSLALMQAGIVRSGLSTMLMRGCEMLPFRTQSDMWVTLENIVQGNSPQPLYVYAYWGDLDELAHRFGPQDSRVYLEFSGFSWYLERFLRQNLARGRKDTLFILAADHGFMTTPRLAELDLRYHPQLFRCLLMPPSGENRLPYLFLRSGCEAEARAYIEQTWPGRFEILTTEQVLRSGLFGSGEPDPRLPERLGDWVLIPRDSAYLWWANKENTLLGRHGGLSAQEMLVPFCTWVL